MNMSRRGWLAMLGAVALACVGAGKKHKGKTITKELWLCQEGTIHNGEDQKWIGVALTCDPLHKKYMSSPELVAFDATKFVGYLWTKYDHEFQEFGNMRVGESVKVRMTFEVLE